MVETMLFCSNCGGPVNAGDAFCGKCGARQPGAPAPGPASAGATPPPLSASPGARPGANAGGLTPESASTLCYVPWFGWIASIYVLASERFRAERETRFHAFQGLYLFVVWLIVNQVLVPMFRMPFVPNLGWPLRMAVIGVGIYMVVKTSQRVRVVLPIIGELAEKSASEQN